MFKIASIFCTLLVTSCFFFPFNPTFLPFANSKMIVAAFGLLALIINLAKEPGKGLNYNLLPIFIYSIIISLTSFLTAIIHSTNDYTYASFFISFMVWTGAAYTCILLIRLVHGYVSVRLVCDYIISVCVVQCIIALSMDYFNPLKTFVDSIVSGEGFMGKAGDGRLYGIGCALDVAGGRFATTLCMIAYLCVNNNELEEKKHYILYILAFAIILIIGSMIGRSTIIGAIMAIAYWIYASGVYQRVRNAGWRKLLKWLSLILITTIPMIIYFYNNNAIFYHNLRFGFEGFFNLFEKGHWETNSNNILQNMIVFPDNLATWIIGDGYIENPNSVDPYYVGKQFHGFYMGTDIGYIRFIFYFGIIGMLAMITYIVKVATTCISEHPKYKPMFLMILILNLIYWCKVSTDLFLVFAPFLLISNEENISHLIRKNKQIYNEKSNSSVTNEDIKWES